MMKKRLSRTNVESDFDVCESENLSDFGFAKNCQNLATFIFKLCVTRLTDSDTAAGLYAPPKSFDTVMYG